MASSGKHPGDLAPEENERTIGASGSGCPWDRSLGRLPRSRLAVRLATLAPGFPQSEQSALKQRTRGHAAKGRECHGPRIARQACDRHRRKSGHRQSHRAGIGSRRGRCGDRGAKPGDLEATARELGAETNRRIVPLAADVTSKEQVDRMVAAAAQQLGGVHILVNSGSAPGGRPPPPGRSRRSSTRICWRISTSSMSGRCAVPALSYRS